LVAALGLLASGLVLAPPAGATGVTNSGFYDHQIIEYEANFGFQLPAPADKSLSRQPDPPATALWHLGPALNRLRVNGHHAFGRRRLSR
jgi:hypothetical protein